MSLRLISVCCNLGVWSVHTQTLKNSRTTTTTGTSGSQVLHRKPGSNDPIRMVLQAESSDVMRRWIDILEDVKIAATRRSVENQLDTFLGRT